MRGGKPAVYGLKLCLVSGLVMLAALVGCTKQDNPQDLKEKTAQATAQFKRDAEAVASGVREGWNRDKPLDLNSASKQQLLTLPGLTAAEADRIISGRPYDQPGDLVTRRIISKTEYDRISDRVKASR
jgi:DNA uptake protein ComE-like DNA-binding protein